jgi:osmotically-inducible protein OsmY
MSMHDDDPGPRYSNRRNRRDEDPHDAGSRATRRSRGRDPSGGDRYKGGQQPGGNPDRWPGDQGSRRPSPGDDDDDRYQDHRQGRRNRPWFRAGDDALGGASGRYGAGGAAERAYGSDRPGGAYGDDDMPSGGSLPRGRSYGGEAMAGATRRAVSGGLCGTTPEDGVGAVAGRVVGPGRSGDVRPRGMAGKGPRGYIRSDQRIREYVGDLLTDNDSLDASAIDVQVEAGEVTLDGTVDTRIAKRHAEDLIDRVSGVKHVQNNLRVAVSSKQNDGSPNADIGPTS